MGHRWAGTRGPGLSGAAVVVLAAMPRELRPLVRALRLRAAPFEELPAWRDDRVLAVAVGVGPSRAGAGAAQVLDAIAARRVVITGVAGALDTSLGVGDLVRPSLVVDVRSGVVRTPSTPAPGGGVLATVERVHLPGRGPAGSGDLLPAGTTAVDMETAAIAAVCEAKGVPWDVVRAVSDVAGTLTQEAASLLRPDGRTDIPKAARLALRDPRAIGRLVRLGLDSARAVRVATGAVVSELAVTDPGRQPDGSAGWISRMKRKSGPAPATAVWPNDGSPADRAPSVQHGTSHDPPAQPSCPGFPPLR